jgi:hypothetical protein
MPLFRYFVFMGGILLGLLFLADWYLPAPATAVAANDVDRSIIRIHSGHKWPAAISFDTRAPMPAPPAAPVIAAAAPVSPPSARVRQAYAFEPPPQKVPEKVRRRAKPSRPALRESTQRFANYQPPDSRGWPPAGW